MKNDNTDMQVVFDGFAQTLEEIKEAVLNNTQSALTADLLNKIQKTIDQSKKAIDNEDLKKFIKVVISVTTELKEDSDKIFAQFLNQKIEELREIANSRILYKIIIRLILNQVKHL